MKRSRNKKRRKQEERGGRSHEKVQEERKQGKEKIWINASLKKTYFSPINCLQKLLLQE